MVKKIAEKIDENVEKNEDENKVGKVKKKRRITKYTRRTAGYHVNNPESGMSYHWGNPSDKKLWGDDTRLGYEPIIAADHPNLIIGGQIDPRTGYYIDRELVLMDIPTHILTDRAADVESMAKVAENNIMEGNYGTEDFVNVRTDRKTY